MGVKDLRRLLFYGWSLRRFEWSGQRDFISAAEHKGTPAARLLTSGWVMLSPIFNKHTCVSIYINAHVSIGAQVSSHIHLLRLWGRRFPFKPPLCLSSRAVTFAAGLVLHGLTFRFRKTHRLCRRESPQNVIMWPACADPQACTSMRTGSYKLSAVSMSFSPVLCETNQRKEEIPIRVLNQSVTTANTLRSLWKCRRSSPAGSRIRALNVLGDAHMRRRRRSCCRASVPGCLNASLCQFSPSELGRAVSIRALIDLEAVAAGIASHCWNMLDTQKSWELITTSKGATTLFPFM